MKSLTNAIIGVTSGVAAFVVLDLLRHHGVEMRSIEWTRASLSATVDGTRSDAATGNPAQELVRSVVSAIAADRGEADAESVEGPKGSASAAAVMDAPRSSSIDLEDVVVSAEISESQEPSAAEAGPGRSTAASAVSESSPSDLARAGERAKALAAAMERLGKRLDGTASRRFPR
jgi:hypothetical protein